MIVLRIFNGLFVLAFAASAALQYNDPDPLRWVAIYFFAAAASIAWETGWLHRLVPIPLMGVATLWAVYSGMNTHLEVPAIDALRDWEMHAGGAEELRETLGLALVAAWTGVLAIVER